MKTNFFQAMLVVLPLAASTTFAGTTRHPIDSSDANLIALQNLSVTAPGTGQYKSTYTVGGCRGGAYLVDLYYDGTASGNIPGADQAYAKFTLQDGIFYGSTLYNAVTNTSQPCSAPFSSIGHSGHLMHGHDTVDLYYTNSSGCSGVSANMFDVTMLDYWDDHGDIVLDVKKLPPDGKAKAHPHLTNPNAYPANVRVWSIRGDGEEATLGCTINATTGEITAGKASGTIIVRVSASDAPSCFIEKELTIGCDDCIDCPNVGAGTLGVSSVDISIGAGRAEFGKSAGRFQIKAESPSAALSTPQFLNYYIGGVDTNQVVVLKPSGFVRQVFTPQSLANVVSNSPTQYKIEFYEPGTYSTQPTNGGLYSFGGSPAKVWTITNPDSPAINHLNITESVSGKTNVYDYVWDASVGGWELTSGGGTRKEKRWSITNGVVRTEIHLIRDGANNIKFQETNTFQTFAWGEELVQNTVGTGANALVTQYSYYTNATDTANYSRLQRMVSPTGKWEQYTYNSAGRVTSTARQVQDNAIPANSAQFWSNEVTTNLYYLDGFESVTYLNSQLTEHTLTLYDTEERGQTDTYRETIPGGFSNQNYLLENRWVYLTPPSIGEPRAVWHEDGTWTFYRYVVSLNGGFRTNTVETGQAAANDPSSYVVDGTRTITVTDKGGNRVSEMVYDVASGLLVSLAVATSTDAYGRALSVQFLDNTTEVYSYNCCGLESFTDREGVTTTYERDYLNRKTFEFRDGIGTRYQYDAAGNLERTTRIGTDSSEIILNFSTFDTARRLISSTAPPNGSGSNRTTTVSYSFDGSSHPVKTTTFPDSGTQIETSYLDGRRLSVAGTAAFPRKFEYSIDSINKFAKEIQLGRSGEETEWTKTYTDIAGRDYLTVEADGATNRMFFNGSGQMIRQVDADGNIYRYSYNGRGEREYSGIDFDRNGAFSSTTTDRVRRSLKDVVINYGTTVLRTRIYVWPTNNNGNSVLIQTEEASADGLRKWVTSFGRTNQTITTFAGGGSKTVTSIAADGSFTVSSYQNGRLTSETMRDSTGNQIGQTTTGYDAHRRRNTVADARNGTTTYVWNDADQISSITTPAPGVGQSAQVTTSYFDERDRIVRIALSDGTYKTNEFFPTGLRKKISGSREYPVEYTYDSQGRVKTMTTWQNFASSQGAAVTTWNYDSQRGWLTSKRDANNQGETYTRTASGRLRVRSLARGVSSTNTYNFAGGLATVTYSDGLTPQLTFNYDRIDELTNVVQTLAGQYTNTVVLSLNQAGLALSEANTGGLLSGLTVTNAYDTLLRRTAVGLNTQTSALSQFGYDNASRLKSVTNGVNSATYSYLANSPLVETITFKQSGTTRLTTTKSYDYLNRQTSIQSSVGASPVTSFAYQYNDANQRTRRTETDNSYWVYEYDSLGQVKSGKKYWSDGIPVAGQQHEYTFDDIGNRKTTKAGGNTSGSNLRLASYGANLLNQYTNRTVPGAVDILSSANSNATVTVWGVSNLYVRAVGQGEYFWGEVPLSNNAAPVWMTLTNIGVLNNGTNADIVTTDIGSVLLPKTPEAFTYDLDGNLTSDGLWTNKWDAENRLIEMQSLASVLDVAKQKLTFDYDYQGRRIRKVAYAWNGSAYVAQSTNKFVWDDWNLLAEVNHTNGLVRSYSWGLDLRLSLRDGGGVGALLVVNIANNGSHFPCYDANGNVMALVDSGNGSTSAQFEYGPFAEPIGVYGVVANRMPIRFSTKYQDDETGCYYYDFRYFKDGRFLSRDPLAEFGGVNLYTYAINAPTIYFDINGQYTVGEYGQITGQFFVGAGQGLGNVGKSVWSLVKSPYTITVGVSQAAGTLSTPYGRQQFGLWVDFAKLLANKYATDICFRELINKKLGAEAKNYFTDPYKLSEFFSEIAVAAGTFGIGAWAETAQGAEKLGQLAKILESLFASNGGKSIALPEELLREMARLEKLWPDQIKALRESGEALGMGNRGKIIAQDGTEITGFTKHGIDRVIGDDALRAGVKPEALLDALKNPEKVVSGVDDLGRPFVRYYGKDARVVVNPQTGQIISVNPLTGAGAH